MFNNLCGNLKLLKESGYKKRRTTMLKVNHHQLYKDDKPFFYLADTCWSAFTNISNSDWKYYLDYLKQQGFNAIQINVLKQWDASGDDLNLYPFPITRHEDGSYSFNYSEINQEYFDRAEQMLYEMQKRDMVPVLVLMWCNYVPGTWASHLAINNQFPYEQIESYVKYVTNRFKKFNPIYFVSGDTDFPTDETVKYYRKVFKVARETDPNAIYTFHIKGRFEELPEEFKKDIDFFSYQSGHNFEGQHTAYDIPMHQRSLGFDKPIINTEPCYEQISYSRNMYGRYSAKDVRTASWSSVLSGANAGITYGAHGIWSWHHTGATFGVVEGEGFDSPFDWHDAIHFNGANDIAFLKQIMETEFPNGCYPTNIKINNENSIRSATNSKKDKLIIYLPTNTKVNLKDFDFSEENSQAKVIDLLTHNTKILDWFKPKTLNMSNVQSDCIIILTKE